MINLIIIVFLLFLTYFSYKKPKSFLILSFFIIPFHAFLITWLSSILNLSNNSYILLSAWKEVILLGSILHLIKNYKKINFKLHNIDYFIFAYFFISIIVSLINHITLKQLIWGLRYDFEMFLIYYIFRLLDFDFKYLIKLLKYLIPITLLVSIFALMQVFVLPKDFLTLFGYQIGEWIPNSQSLPAYQQIGISEIIRSQSFLAGPNQLGSFILIPIVLIFSCYEQIKKIHPEYLIILTQIIAIVALLLTYSRSAYLALVIAAFLFLILKFLRNKIIQITLVLLFFIISIFLTFFAPKYSENNFVNNYILHQASSFERQNRYKSNFEILKKNPTGLGLGTSGLAAYRSKSEQDKSIVPENWFIQVGIESGWIGLIIYLIIIIGLIINFAKKAKNNFSKAALIILISLSLHGFFLHTWSDIVTVFWAWAIFGLANNSKIENEKI